MSWRRIAGFVAAAMITGSVFSSGAAFAQEGEFSREQLEQMVREILAETKQDEPSATPLAGIDQRGAFLKSPDGNSLLRINGILQPRYEFTDAPRGESDLSSFYLRRLRLDFRGHVFTPELTYRILPEFVRNANLRDGWINYEFSKSVQGRFGQFTVPFQRQREISSTRQHFTERSLASETFGVFNGRDIGLMLHGGNDDNTTKYAIGFFDGSGRNTQRSNSNSHLLSGRFMQAILGTVSNDETDYGFSEEPTLAVGLGLKASGKDETREWNTGAGAGANQRADVFGATADASFKWQGMSVAADLYHQNVDPDAAGVDSYRGNGWMLTAGYFILPQQLEVVGRYSEVKPNHRVSATRANEYAAGVNIYHRGHNWKTRLNYINTDTDDGNEGAYIAEMSLAF